MTIRHLRIFTMVYQIGNITKAAELLHLAQPSVSLAIRELEQYYHVCLFDRIGRRLYVTKQGEKMYDYALHIISMFDEMESSIRDWESSASLCIGSSITIGNFLMPELVSRFRELHPEVEVQVTIQNSNRIEEAIMDNQLDFALIEGKPHQDKIRQEPFMDDRICFVCAPGHPLAEKLESTPESLAEYPFVLRERGSAGREIVESIMGAHQLDFELLWESVSNQALIRAVGRNIGISALPYLLVEEDIRRGNICVVPLELPELHRQFSIIYHQNKYLSQTAREFMELTVRCSREI